MTRSKFHEIKTIIIENRKNKAKTIAGKKYISLDNAEKLVEDIFSRKINKNEAIKSYNNTVDNVNTIAKSRTTEARTKMLHICKQFRKFFEKPKTDGDETDGEIDDEQPDTTDMLDLESEESVKQTKNKKGQGLKILTLDQTLSRLPISLAQLKAGNNLEILKNEIRQLLYSLYRSKKLSKTVYNNLINTV